MGVVQEGTATRLRGAYRSPDGRLLAVGGKTGTGDNRLDRFGRAGRLISQRVVDRTFLSRRTWWHLRGMAQYVRRHPETLLRL